MTYFLQSISLLLLFLSSCCKVQKLNLEINQSSPISIQKIEKDTSKIENPFVVAGEVNNLSLRLKLKIIHKIKQAKSRCFVIPGRPNVYFLIKMDTIQLAITPKFFRFKRKFYRTSLFKTCQKLIKKANL